MNAVWKAVQKLSYLWEASARLFEACPHASMNVWRAPKDEDTADLNYSVALSIIYATIAFAEARLSNPTAILCF